MCIRDRYEHNWWSTWWTSHWSDHVSKNRRNPQNRLADHRMKMNEIADTVGIFTERVCNILHKHLCMTKLCTRWVPRLLTHDKKQCWKDVSTDCLALYTCNPTKFLDQFITVDETWIHHNTPEITQQSMDCKRWTAVSYTHLDVYKRQTTHLYSY